MGEDVKRRLDRVLNNYDRGIVQEFEAQNHFKMILMSVPMGDREEIFKYCRSEGLPILATVI